MEWMRSLGATGIPVSAIIAGGASFDGRRSAASRPPTVDANFQTILDLFESRIRTIDTSSAYGDGGSEDRIGEAIIRAGGLPEGFTILTKVAGQAGAFTGQAVRRTVSESKRRLGLAVLPLLYLHDPEFHSRSAIMEPGGVFDTLLALQAEGEIGHLGLAGGYLPDLNFYLDTGAFEVLLVHNRWTLVDRSADSLIDRARRDGIAVVNAAIYGGGILASRALGTQYAYRPANNAILTAVAGMDAACQRAGMNLASAALQFSLKDPRIDATVVGMSRPSRITASLEAAEALIPDELWSELETLLPRPQFWLDAPPPS